MSLVYNNQLDNLYNASKAILQSITRNEKENNIMSDCIKYNAFKISRPNIETLNIQLNHPIDEYYDEWLYNKIPAKKKSSFDFTLENITKYDSFFDWAKKVVWYGHRTGAYLSGDVRMEKDIAGHY